MLHTTYVYCMFNVAIFMINTATLATVVYLFYKWKNHFSEMKGDVGMSLHEKEGEQEDA